ncbi:MULTISPECIES: hypothetical protein [unclassified Aerococcus]|uniref:hypothetical protein n=1 Tax=unclassified Aerococcus TaxID=2618060 RepID=UPI0008A18586|nr:MULTISPECIES: hypothetical protein [unclassified Aerococcus]MDK6679208.1 hypothetical protein [Aerococcus sp. UMB8608]MDK6685950.1 hypothetical protein [Aerococcus sp. UMB8623]MDK6940754.1 hypothetical protein [Aerococcus sp. UMB8487]OFK21272.1 hypothetical protein HMPREF2829_03775 [Aerococcus sp. HMSC072A12]OFR32572.1 hypothetical protein HMPREF2892_08140 [Aerococcus sp. HMSC061A03]
MNKDNILIKMHERMGINIPVEQFLRDNLITSNKSQTLFRKKLDLLDKKTTVEYSIKPAFYAIKYRFLENTIQLRFLIGNACMHKKEYTEEEILVYLDNYQIKGPSASDQALFLQLYALFHPIPLLEISFDDYIKYLSEGSFIDKGSGYFYCWDSKNKQYLVAEVVTNYSNTSIRQIDVPKIEIINYVINGGGDLFNKEVFDCSMLFDIVKRHLMHLGHNFHPEFVKSIISIETGNIDNNQLDEKYQTFMKSESNFLDESFL